MKDQLINQNIFQLNAINKLKAFICWVYNRFREVTSKTERLNKLQKEMASEQSKFTQFDYMNKQRVLEVEMQTDHFESEIENLNMAINSRERDLEYKTLEYEHAQAELMAEEQKIKQARSFLVTQGEKIARLKESIQSSQIRKMLTQSQAAMINHQMQSQILLGTLPPEVKRSLIQQAEHQRLADEQHHVGGLQGPIRDNYFEGSIYYPPVQATIVQDDLGVDLNGSRATNPSQKSGTGRPIVNNSQSVLSSSRGGGTGPDLKNSDIMGQQQQSANYHNKETMNTIDSHHPSVQTDMYRFSTFDQMGGGGSPYTVLDSIVENQEETSGLQDRNQARRNNHKKQSIVGSAQLPTQRACCAAGGCNIM